MAAIAARSRRSFAACPICRAGEAATKVYAELFDSVATVARESTDATAQAAAVRSLLLMPASALPAGRVEPLARALVARVRDTPADRRTTPAMLDVVELGGRLADALPGGHRRSAPPRARHARRSRRSHRGGRRGDAVRSSVVRRRGRPSRSRSCSPIPTRCRTTSSLARPGRLTQIGQQGSSMPMPADPNAAQREGVRPQSAVGAVRDSARDVRQPGPAELHAHPKSRASTSSSARSRRTGCGCTA